jgi:hypothetical protein
MEGGDGERTMTSWLDFGNFQDLFEVLRDKVTDSQTNAFEGTFLD